MTLGVLYVLALLDGVLCGLRTSMGRCPLVHKSSYYLRAAVTGLAAAQLASTLALAALAILYVSTQNRAALRIDLQATAARMLCIFVPYTALTLFGFVVRLTPSTDIRSMSSVLALGPLTAARPLVMMAGVVYGISQSRLAGTRLLGMLVLALMLALEFGLNRRADRLQHAHISSLIQDDGSAQEIGARFVQAAPE